MNGIIVQRGSSRAVAVAVAIAVAIGLVVGGSGLVAHAAAAATADDPGWPRVYATASGGRLQIYQPQIASWEGQAHLVAYLAVAYTPANAPAPVLGTIKVEADTRVSLEQRLVNFATFRITETNFPTLARTQTREVVAEIDKAIPSVERVIALERVLAGLDRSSIRPKNVEGVKADPPVILVSTTPALLVHIDGEPVWSPIKDTDLRYAVNTSRDLFEHAQSKTFFLRHEYVWLKAAAISGPWMPAGTLPVSFTKLPSDEAWLPVKTSLPGRRIGLHEMPKVFVSTAPAELIELRGAAHYVPVPGSAPLATSDEGPLLWIDNTDSDVFRLGASGRVFYLAAGRWFSAPDFAGPWTFATPTLPAAFRGIPLAHPRARVLVSIPGTPQAVEAVVLAQIPQTARITKAALKAPEVRYQGEPRFVAIERTTVERTTVERAVNTDKDIVRVGGAYYLCFQGVWFIASTPAGPWVVTGFIPPAIFAIPASSPIHHITYVTVVEDHPDYVVVAARAGYTGTMIAWGCAVWGTGWYYPPYVAYAGAYPIYRPFVPTYGYAAGLNAVAGFNAVTGTYARGAVAYGPYGARGAAQAYNPRTNTYAQTRQGAGVYGSWGSSYVQRGDEWAQTARVTNNVTGNTTRVARTDEGAAIGRAGANGRGFVAAGDEGLYAGRDGNVYRLTGDDGWQKYENGSWGSTGATRPDTAARGANAGTLDRSTIGQLDRDRTARVEGTQRVRERGATRRGGGPRSR